MGVNFSMSDMWTFKGKEEDQGDKFFAPLWTDRTENAYKGFFSEGGWKKPKEWFNPGGVMANPAQQIADPGNFFTTGEQENWVTDGEVSDRTLASAAAAALAYGGGSAISGMMGGGSSGGGGAAAGGGEIMAGTGDVAQVGGGGAGSSWTSGIKDFLGGSNSSGDSQNGSLDFNANNQQQAIDSSRLLDQFVDQGRQDRHYRMAEERRRKRNPFLQY